MAEKIEAKEEKITAWEKHRSAWIRYGKEAKAAAEQRMCWKERTLMAKIHDKFVIELAEVIKGYGNDPDVDDPFHLSEFYRFYELPEIAVSANHFKTMIPLELEIEKQIKALPSAQQETCAYWDSESNFCALHRPSAQPEPISEAYAKAVRTWLVNYQVKCAELQGRYTPYEVLGWIVSDWRKENGIW